MKGLLTFFSGGIWWQIQRPGDRAEGACERAKPFGVVTRSTGCVGRSRPRLVSGDATHIRVSAAQWPVPARFGRTARTVRRKPGLRSEQGRHRAALDAEGRRHRRVRDLAGVRVE